MSATANNLQDVRRRIAEAARRSNRDAASIRLIAVSKTFPASAVADAIAADQYAFGENYVQEADEKIDRVAEIVGPDRQPEWHFIGPIQSNKTRAIAARFDWVHSVDRLKTAERLSNQRDPARGPLNVLVEVNVDGEASKSGIAPSALPALASAVAALPNLSFRGLMTVPAPHPDDASQRAAFAKLRVLAEDLRRDGLPCDELSMGMSADLEAAIAEGATMVRVGTAIFGTRSAPPPAAGDR